MLYRPNPKPTPSRTTAQIASITGLSLGGDMRRRQFIRFVGGAVAAWPLAALAQQGERMRRVADDLDYQAFVAAFLQGLGQLGWIVGRNMRIDTRWATADTAAVRRHATELAALAP